MLANVGVCSLQFDVNLPSPHLYLQQMDLVTQSKPSSDFKFCYLGNPGHTAGTVNPCSVLTEAIKTHQVGF
jgi:hypothetical protein